MDNRVRCGNIVEWDNHSAVRDPHEKLRFSDSDYPALVLVKNDIWGCEDLYPHADSELVLLGKITEQT